MEAKNRRAWIKNVAIIFLTVLLLLTFFSNTILNYSLPEVSAQYARYDSISGAIKANGTVKANESYVVTYDEAEGGSEVTTPGQTRKVVSVYVKQGSEVAIGDPILALEGGASDELEEAEKKLRELEKQYALDQLTDTINDLTADKSQTESLNTLNKSKTQLAELQELYTALAAGTDPTETLKAQKKTAQKEADNIQKQIDAISEKITETKNKISAAEGNIEEDYTSGKTLTERQNEAKQKYDTLKAEYDALTTQVDTLEVQYENASGLSGDVSKAYEISKEIHTLTETLNDKQKELNRLLEDFSGSDSTEDTVVSGEVIQVLQKAYDDAKAALEKFEKSDKMTVYKNYVTYTEKLEYAKALWEECKLYPGSGMYNETEIKKEMADYQALLDGIDMTIVSEYQSLSNAFNDAKANLNKALPSSSTTGSDDISGMTGTSSSLTSTTSKERQIEDLREEIAKLQYQITENYAKLDILGVSYIDNLTDYAVDTNTTKLKEELDKAQKKLTELTTEYEEAKKTYESLTKQVNSTSVISENEVLLATFEADLETYKEKLEEANEKVADLEEEITNNKTSKTADEVKKEIDELSASIQALEVQMQIDSVTDKKTDTESSYTREDQAKEIEELKTKIKAMQEAPNQTVVTAPIAGKIVEVNFVPGNKVTSGNEVARIEVADKGYICEISMSTDEARKIQVGAECSVTNSWWYSDLTATVSQIRSDPQSQGKNRIVVIEVKGDVYEGQSLSFSIGDKSQSYDSVLPNSAIREDSEGKFVLVVESKNTPLSVRYTARRMSIEVIASDDTKSAVSGLYGSEFVITSATSPISDGQQVRLAEN